MLTNLNRTEEIHIKNDIHNIAKSLATIASSMPNTETERTEKKDSVVDPFFGKIHMSKEHMDAWEGDFDTYCLALVNLMEECAELQQAASKYYRKYRDSTGHEQCVREKYATIEEIAHVLIDIRMICHELGISPEEIQQEIYKKYPEGYEERTKGSK